MIVDGIGRASELEDKIDPVTSRPFLERPEQLLETSHPVMDAVRKTYNPASGLVCLGGFQNVRNVFGWEGFTLELDETRYDWGTVYEIEVETTEPEALRDKLEAFLKEHGVGYKYSTVSKFANFRNRTLE